MVMILDNSSADIAIVMPKPDLSREEFSYSNLYCFDYNDGATAGVTGASVESSAISVSGNGGDDKLVSFKIWTLSYSNDVLCAFFCSFSHCLYYYVSNDIVNEGSSNHCTHPNTLHL